VLAQSPMLATSVVVTEVARPVGMSPLEPPKNQEPADSASAPTAQSESGVNNWERSRWSPNGLAVHRRRPRRDEARISEHSKAAVGVRCNCKLGAPVPTRARRSLPRPQLRERAIGERTHTKMIGVPKTTARPTVNHTEPLGAVFQTAMPAQHHRIPMTSAFTSRCSHSGR
jgi:hypothetical protein